MMQLNNLALSTQYENEWLEADGFGGFASGTVGTQRTRRYHALLLCATKPPAGRMVLVNGVEAWLGDASREQRISLSSHRYCADYVSADLTDSLLSFEVDPWPTWRFQIGDGQTVIAEVFVAKASQQTVLRWKMDQNVSPNVKGERKKLTLNVRPLLSGRDYHALHHHNPNFKFAAERHGDQVHWQPYGDVPVIVAASNGEYKQDPDWYRDFCYLRERERGLDFREDLATPGIFSFDLLKGEAVLVLSAYKGDATSALETAGHLAHTERTRRAAFSSGLERAADAYIVARNSGKTILAGFPWFTDWGRDTFIAMRGLLIANNRLDDARSILLEWASTISKGMLPNRFPDDGAPEYNSVDASLWFVVAVHDYLCTGHASVGTTGTLRGAVERILFGYQKGTRFGIGADADGLIKAGIPGLQLTWMDAKVGDWVVTPRIGKPVEIQALWINALLIASEWNLRWKVLAEHALSSFKALFLDTTTGTLHDVVDVDHEPGKIDRSVRPNQLFAVGGLPFKLLEREEARPIVELCERHLLTPLGLRTLSPDDPQYQGRYGGVPLQRDGAYHQGTIWPWLLGPFVDAWLFVNDDPAGAQKRFLVPLRAHLHAVGLDHISEVADGDSPHAAGGAPFQAWSLGELLRLEQQLAATLSSLG